MLRSYRFYGSQVEQGVYFLPEQPLVRGATKGRHKGEVWGRKGEELYGVISGDYFQDPFMSLSGDRSQKSKLSIPQTEFQSPEQIDVAEGQICSSQCPVKSVSWWMAGVERRIRIMFATLHSLLLPGQLVSHLIGGLRG